MSTSPPKADKIAGASVGLLCAISGHMHRSKQPPSLNHFIGQCQQSIWDVEAKRSGSLEINNQRELRRLYHRQIGGLGAVQNSASVNPKLTIGSLPSSFAWAVVMQPRSIDQGNFASGMS
jgi:hypothetical protein